jgi:hypothetical protein
VSRPSEHLDLATLDDLQRAADYRTAVLRVRAAAGRSLIASVLALLVVLGSLVDRGGGPALVWALVLAILLLAGGVLNLARPKAVWVLMGGALLLLLVVVVGYTAFVEAKGAPASLLRITDLGLAALTTWVLASLRRYPRYRRALAGPPARELRALVGNLAIELRDGDIGDDPRMIELWGRPCWKGKLIGGVGVFADAAGCEVRFALREEVELVIDDSPEIGTKPLYLLRIREEILVGRMDAVSHDRYLAWKSGGAASGHGGQTPGHRG